MKSISAYIVDDSQNVRRRFAAYLSEIPSVTVVGSSGCLSAARKEIATLRPDVVVLDICLPDGNGLQLLPELKSEPSPPVVIIITNFPYPHYRKRSMEMGADFFLDKSLEFERLAEIIHFSFAGVAA